MKETIQAVANAIIWFFELLAKMPIPLQIILIILIILIYLELTQGYIT